MQTHTVDPLKFVVAVLAAQVIGGLVSQMSPLVVGGLIIGLELSEQQAGYVAFAEFIVLSITAIAIAPSLPKLSCRALCFRAAIVAVAAQLASIVLTDFHLVVAMRCIAGIGEGLVYAASLAIVASRSVNPDKLYGYIQANWAILSAVLFTAGGYLTDLFAHRGIYGMIAVVSVLLVVYLKWLPDDATVSAESTGKDDTAAPPWMGVIALGGIFIYILAASAIYTFMVPLGERAGLSTSQIGYALTASTVVGFTGALLATWLNVRIGRVIPVSIFSVGLSVIAIVLCVNTEPIIYVINVALSMVFFYFSVPYLFGLAAALDRQGRWAAAAGSAYLLGFGVAPAFAGTMIEWHDYIGLGVASVIATLLGWMLLVVIAGLIENMDSE